MRLLPWLYLVGVIDFVGRAGRPWPRDLLRAVRAVGLCGSIGLLALSAPPVQAAQDADFVFIVDASRSMRRDLGQIVLNLARLDDAMEDAEIRARYALVRFGTNRSGDGPLFPELVVDFTGDFGEFQDGLASLPHQLVDKTEAGTEAILFSLQNLAFRPDAIPTVVLYTDENDDSPATSGEKREPPFLWNRYARSAAFQLRIDDASEALIAKRAHLDLIIRPWIRNVQRQYGIPDATEWADDNCLDIEATHANLVAAERTESLQARLLAAGLPARAFYIRDARQRLTAPIFWDLYIAARTREILKAPVPVPEPGPTLGLLAALSGLALASRGAHRRR